MGSRGVYKDGWFAGTFGPRTPWSQDTSRLRNWDPDEDVWELYDLTQDYSQANDLSAQMPEKVKHMKDIFLVEAQANKVLPIGAGLYTFFYHPEEAPRSPLKEWNFYPGQVRIAESNAPLFRSGFSSLSTVLTDVPVNASGVLYCVGGGAGGFSVYMDGGYLYAEYMATLLYRYTAKSSAPVKPGLTKIQVRLDYEDLAPVLIPAANLTLLVDDQEVGGARVEKSIRGVFDASETFDVGMDLGAPVSRRYEDRLPFKYSGIISKLNIKYLGSKAMPPHFQGSQYVV